MLTSLGYLQEGNVKIKKKKKKKKKKANENS